MNIFIKSKREVAFTRVASYTGWKSGGHDHNNQGNCCGQVHKLGRVALDYSHEEENTFFV